MTSFMLNPYVFGGCLVVIGITMVILGRYAEIRIQSADRRLQKGLGHGMVLAGIAWMAIPVAIYPVADDAKLDVLTMPPKQFMFSTVMRYGDQNCKILEEDYCTFRFDRQLRRQLPEHRARCVVTSNNIPDAQKILQHGGVTISADTFYLLGTINYSPFTGVCTIYFAEQSRGSIAEGQHFETRYRCSFDRICQ